MNTIPMNFERGTSSRCRATAYNLEPASRRRVMAGYILDLCRRGVVPSEKLGKYRRIPEDGLSEWQRASFDSVGSVTLPSSYGPRSGPPHSQGVDAHRVAVRRAPRRPP